MAHLRPTLLLALWPALINAAALTDGSTGAVQSLSGQFTVPQSLGTVRGANLFHSFTRFGIATGESATFNTGDAGIRHVIGRVTGGEASTLQGPLRLQAATGSRPDFWLVNPSGITVGAGASFDVPAGLHLSTAQQLRFADGLAWDTRGGAPSTLSVAAPENFGFLGPQAAAALRWSDTDLILQQGSTLSLSGGKVSLQRAQLAAPGGRVELLSPGAVELSERAQLYASTGADASSGHLRVDAAALTLDARNGFASLLVETLPGSQARGDAMDLRVAGPLVMLAGADISAASADDRPAGRLRLAADTLTLDGLGARATSISSYAFAAGTGSAIEIDVAGRAAFVNGGQTFAATASAGRGGDLNLRAGSLAMDGGGNFAFIGTQSLSAASGDAGDLRLQVGAAATLAAGSEITSSTSSSGAAGRLDLNAGSLRIDGQGLDGLTGLHSVGAGPTLVQVSGALDLLNGGTIRTTSLPEHAPAALRVTAGNANIDGGGKFSAAIFAFSTNSTPTADVSVEVADRLQLRQGGQISSGTLGPAAAGAVSVKARAIDMQGGGESVTVISSNSLVRQGGHSGDVSVEAQTLNLTSDAAIHADTFADQGNAGRITVRADRMVLDGQGRAGGIHSFARGAHSAAGNLHIEARESLILRDGASIMAGTQGDGGLGQVQVTAPTLLIDGKGAQQTFTGIAGDVLAGLGAGANVVVEAGRLDVRNGGTISSSTYTSTDAGSVRVLADVLTLDGGDRSSATSISADSGGSGRAGNLFIRARELTLANEALISSSSLASGPGGTISIEAGNFNIDTAAGVFSVAASSGAAGNIDVRVSDALVMRQGAAMTANTGGSGAGGRINVQAGSLQASGVDAVAGFRTLIISRARPGSGGQPGSIDIDVKGAFGLSDGAGLSIANDATVPDAAAILPTRLSVRARQIQLSDADISAAATSNANAGRIVLTSAGSLQIDRSSVRTSALDGDGGPIAVDAAGLARLRDARITTSVEGRSNGNGGDISLAAPALVLESGFIQANTSAPLARGGDVRVDVRTLLPNGSQVFIGGNRVEAFRPGLPGFNVIQAAAPEGLSGTLDVSIPQLNLSGSLAGLSTAVIDFGLLGRDACQIGTQSSLTLLGRGMAASTANGPLRLEP